MRTGHRVIATLVTVMLSAPAGALASPKTGGVGLPEDAARTILGGDYGEQIGAALASPGDVSGDGKRDLLVGTALVHGTGPEDQPSGGAYLVRGPGVPLLGATGGTLPAALGYGIVAADGSAPLQGASAAALGDVNGDAVPDIALVGTDGAQARRVHVVYGRAGDQPRVALTAPAPVADGYVIEGPVSRVAAAGDVNADGVGDVLLALPDRALVLFGRAGRSTIAVDQIAPADGMTITGLAPAAVAAAGDVNGDGVADVVLGAPRVSEPGRAYVVYGSATPPATVAVADSMPILRGFAIREKTTQYQGSPFLGRVVAGIGDANHDGFGDVAISSLPLNRVFVVHGRAAAGTTELDPAGSPAAPMFVMSAGMGDNPRLGAALAGVGDIDGDGNHDLAIGTTSQTGNYGWVHVMRNTGAPSTTVPIPQGVDGDSTIPPELGFIITRDSGDEITRGLGETLAPVGPGLLAVGAQRGGGGLAGAVYLVPTSQKAPTLTYAARLFALKVQFAARRFAARRAGNGGTSLTVTTAARASVGMTLYRVGTTSRCTTAGALGLRRGLCLPQVRRVTAGRVAPAASGLRRVGFSGRAAGRALSPGKYLAAFQATAPGKRSPVRTLRFEITG